MRLLSFSILNYRGAINVQGIPISSTTVFVGKNDSGKSIVLNAIATFLDIKNFPVLDIDFFDDTKEIILEGHYTDKDLVEKVSKKIGTKMKKDEGKDEFIQDLIQSDRLGVKRVIEEAGKSYSSTLIKLLDYDHDDFTGLYEKSDDELNGILSKFKITIPAIGAGRNSKLEKIKHIKEHCETENIGKKFSWVSDEYNIASILPEIELFKSDYGIEADTAFKTISVTEVKDVLDNESSGGGRLAGVAEKIEAEMSKESEAIAVLMREYVPSLRSVGITPNFAWKDAIKSVDVNFELEGDSKPINMTRKGSGYRRLFMVARFRYLAHKKKGENVIYAIEEPETYLHPSAQEDLLNALQELSEENQILLATHSPVFAGAAEKSSVVLCQKTVKGSVYTTEADNTDIPAQIIEELGIKPSYNLRDTYTKILFCESKNDIRFYDEVATKVLGKTISNNENILCLPGGGGSLEDIINIDYFTKTGRNIYLLADSDKCQSEQVQQSNKDRVAKFDKLQKAKGYLLQKSCIENYYHPKAFERVYGDLRTGTCKMYSDNANVKESLANMMKETGIQIKQKNNHEVFEETTKAEWEELVENELLEFLKEIVG